MLPLTILVVDDDGQIRDVLTRVFTETGYTVRGAVDGLAAFDEIDRRRPDLVISDVDMPVLDGFSLLARIRQRGWSVPVVLMSDSPTRLPLMGIPVVTKPVDIVELLVLAAHLLRRTDLRNA